MQFVIKEQPQLFADAIAPHLPINPRDPDGWSRSKKQLDGSYYPREELSTILLDYNAGLRNDEVALKNAARLVDKEAYCVLTGQQLGFMGGPIYTILKAITCVLVAREHQAIPIFWLATEDHDIDEIDHTFLLDPFGNLRKMHLPLPKENFFVEDLKLSSQSLDGIRAFLETVGKQDLFPLVAQETSYAKAMAKLLVKVFQGTGLLFVEPYLLRPLGRSFFKKEIEQHAQISKVLKESSEKLVARGAQPKLSIDQGTNIFFKYRGKYREKIKAHNGEFVIAKELFTKKQLLELVDLSPELFSTNAQARAVFQSSLFPTAAYVAGPGELAYYLQLVEYHSYHSVPMPWILPRISATFVPAIADEMLNKCGLKAWENIPLHWPEVFENVAEGVEDLAADWVKTGLKIFGQDFSHAPLERFIRNSARRLGRKVASRRVKKRGIPPHALHYLRNLLRPREKLQERVLNWWEFQGQSEKDLVKECLRKMDWHAAGHHYCIID